MEFKRGDRSLDPQLREGRRPLSRTTLLITQLVLICAVGTQSTVVVNAIDAGPTDHVVTTHHQMKLGQRILRYTARAGWLPIRENETGQVRGWMFFVAYLLDRRTGDARRPLTFLWNGGPGANSTLVHLSGFGPKRFKSTGDAGASNCDCEFEDNQTTWLDQTDLVFVDPIGTGFSRPAKAEYANEFYSTLGDIASVAEFVRVYRTRFDAWDAPLFIAGESYGVWRATGVAENLEQRGQRVAGVMLISGGLPVGPVLSDEMRAAMFVPTRTAASLFHRKLAPDLQKDPASTMEMVEKWARSEYGPALMRRELLSDAERERIALQLAGFTGVDASIINRQTLILSRQQFAEQLLSDRRQVLGRFDTRLTSGMESRSQAARRIAINKYFRVTLKFDTDLAYEGVEDGFAANGRALAVGSRWNYNQGPPPPPGTPPNTDAPPGGSQPWLRRAMAINPSIKTFVAAGLYDSLNSCAANSYVIENLESSMSRNITTKCYEGGHMMYETSGVRERLKRDIEKFITDTVAIRRAR
jgi:carboxypeptidase C (cathepsin A)